MASFGMRRTSQFTKYLYDQTKYGTDSKRSETNDKTTEEDSEETSGSLQDKKVVPQKKAVGSMMNATPSGRFDFY